MSKIVYSKEQLVTLFRPKPIESLPNAKYFQSLLKVIPTLLKQTNQVPVNFHTDALVIKGFNQEILVYSSNTPTPLKTVGAQTQDQFRFDEQIFTPQPQTSEVFFKNGPVNKPAFSHSRQMRTGDLQELAWYYIDDSNNVQGPFSTIEMDSWYTKGYFDDRTEIAFKTKHAESFLKMKHLKNNRFIKGERQAFKQLIGRRKSAPRIICQSSQEIPPLVADPIIAQTTAKAQQEMFNFPDESSQKVDPSVVTIKLPNFKPKKPKA